MKKKCLAAELLRERGVKLPALREELAQVVQAAAARKQAGPISLTDLVRGITQAASEGQLDPSVGREMEIDTVVEILCCRDRKNALLIGGPGAGKTSIVEGLAQRIAHGKVPLCLAEKRVLALKPELIAGWPEDRQRFEEPTTLSSAGMNPSEIILFLDELPDLLAWTSKFGAPDGAGILRHGLLFTGIQCIATVHVRGDVESAHAISQFGNYFRAVHVRSLDEGSTLSVLAARKNSLESFHGVTYTEEALEFAAYSSASYLPESSLPGKALELLDAAGSMVKLRHAAPPGEIADAEKRVRFIVDRLEKAVANHEFKKARFYSEEQRKEEGNLRALREKFPVDDSSAAIVGADQLKEVVTRWAAYPYCP